MAKRTIEQMSMLIKGYVVRPVIVPGAARTQDHSSIPDLYTSFDFGNLGQTVPLARKPGCAWKENECVLGIGSESSFIGPDSP